MNYTKILRQAMKEYNAGILEEIGCGRSRSVYAIDDQFVLKVDHTWNGRKTEYKANYKEYQVYQNLNSRGQSHKVTQIYSASKTFKYLLVERVDNCYGDCDSYGDYEKIEDDVLREAQKKKLSNIFSDRCIFNFGRRKDGSLVVLDYSD